jgi:hypothetical protein
VPKPSPKTATISGNNSRKSECIARAPILTNGLPAPKRQFYQARLLLQ